MLHRQDRTVRYEAPPTAKKPSVPVESATSPKSDLAAMPDLKRESDPPVDIPQLSRGMEAFHKKFGKGVIKFIDDGKLSVHFSELGETAFVGIFVSKQIAFGKLEKPQSKRAATPHGETDGETVPTYFC